MVYVYLQHSKVVGQFQVAITRGGHCHRRCSHSCDQGQNILTIVFVAWPLDASQTGALTVWPHTLNTNCLPFLMLMAIKNATILTALPSLKIVPDRLTDTKNSPWPLDRFLTPVAAVTTGPMGVTTPCITHPLDFFKLSPELHVAALFCNTPKVAVAMTISSNTPGHHFLQLLGSQMEELQVTTCT